MIYAKYIIAICQRYIRYRLMKSDRPGFRAAYASKLETFG